jgi:hypothetical protein
MADTKISALPASTTPLAGTEVLPIVQSSTTKQVSVANLTAGRSFNALGMTLTSTDAGATAAPLLELYRDSASPAASDTLGEIEFNGEDSAGNKQAYGLIHASILSPTSTAEQGQIHFETATAGALTEKMIIGTNNLVINEIGAVFNVRIEGDTDANLFYTDATNSRIGVGTITPAAKLHVAGSIIYTGTTLASYEWTPWNPSDILGTVTNAPATGTADDSDFVTMANASGTLTITFDVAGKYFICITEQTNHAQIYAFDRMTANLGGTATKRITYNPTNSGVDANDANFSIGTGFYVSATAAQTLTILPTYELTGGGTAAQHTAACNVTIQYCGG